MPVARFSTGHDGANCRHQLLNSGGVSAALTAPDTLWRHGTACPSRYAHPSSSRVRSRLSVPVCTSKRAHTSWERQWNRSRASELAATSRATTPHVIGREYHGSSRVDTMKRLSPHRSSREDVPVPVATLPAP
ncbi:unnamed protein product [Ixodes hexagonus]